MALVVVPHDHHSRDLQLLGRPEDDEVESRTRRVVMTCAGDAPYLPFGARPPRSRSGILRAAFSYCRSVCCWPAPRARPTGQTAAPSPIMPLSLDDRRPFGHACDVREQLKF